MKRTALYSFLAVALLFTLAPTVFGPPLEAVKDPKTLVVLVADPPTTLDPAINYETAGAPALGNIYEGLLRAQGSTEAKIVPWLAESWEKSDDGLTYTFHLRKGIKFHDGTDLNAEAVKFSFERLLKINQGPAANFSSIDKVEAVDDLTVRFTLKFPFASFLASLSCNWGPTVVSPTAVKKHEVNGDLAQAWLAENEAGTGPYKLESWERGQQLTLVRNEDYWGGWGEKYVDKVSFRFVSESTTQRLMIEKGDADMVIGIGMSTEDLDALAKTPGVVVQEYTGQTILEIRINTTKKPLNDVRVRQALAYSFDYDQAVKGIKSGHAARMTSVMPTGLPGYYKPSFTYVKDLDKAQELLAEAGYPKGGFSLTYVWISGLETDRRIGEMWQADLKKLGIDLSIQEMPLATWWDASAHPETAPDIVMGAWTMDYADSTSQLWVMYYSGNFPPAGSNYFFYKNEEVDKLLEQARVEQNPEKRDELYQKAVEIIYGEAPEIWAMQPNDRIAMRDNVKGYQYNFLYSSYFLNLHDIYKE